MRPLILSHQVTRKSKSKIPYEYDTNEDISYIESNNRRLPFIEVDDCESGSLTEIEGEPVDVDMLDLSTKTFTERETDD